MVARSLVYALSDDAYSKYLKIFADGSLVVMKESASAAVVTKVLELKKSRRLSTLAAELGGLRLAL